ncbi:MAG TPA: Swt1 family HEPN domain-containing protein [Thermodesulfovibrionia bacterium]|nr:Swt1 family HEPN domain-containing protein [Thermodesulfovibrionia bacterium]
MKPDFENPFADYGVIVRGDRFIGRNDSLRVVDSRVIRPSEPGNLAIIGDYRIGKSSLVYKAVMESKDSLLTKKQIPVWINLATYDKASIFFRSLVTRCYDEMEDLGWLTEPVKTAANRALQDELSWTEGYGRIQRFFEKIRQTGFRILFILDEFDHARYLFRGDIPGFQGLRELSYRPEWRVTFITISRRTLRDIELQTKAISTFALIFYQHYLGMFDKTDIQDYFVRLSAVGINISPLLKDRVNFYCGGHPYLLEMLGYEIVELFREQQEVDIDKAAHRVEHSCLDQYDHMVSILSEDGSLNKMLQILFGPVVDVKLEDVNKFLGYGLIQLTEKGNYVAFSAHFQTYLKLIERQSDLWPIWRQTEIALRNVVTAAMLNQYGEHWIDKLEKAKDNLKPIFEQCREAQRKEENSFGSRASRNLIDFTYPNDLFAIIFAEWNVFKTIFGKDKNYWSQRAQLLAKIRNPLAHNRDESIAEYERRTTEGYLKEISLILSEQANHFGQ